MFQGVRFGLGLDLSYKYGTTVSSDPNSWDVSGLNLQSGLYTKQYWGYFNDDDSFFNSKLLTEFGDGFGVGSAFQIVNAGVATTESDWANWGFISNTAYDRPESLSTPFPAVGKGVIYIGASAPTDSGTASVGPALKSEEVASVVYGNYSAVPNNDSLIIRGYFKPDVSGLYTFELASDDASYLWLGPNAFDANRSMSNSVVSVPGLHGVLGSTGTFNMVAGLYYPLTIEFGNGPEGAGELYFQYMSPGSSVYSSDLTGKIWRAAGTSGHGQESAETVVTYTDSSVESFNITNIPDNWKELNFNIISVVIGSNVTSIGDYAFDNCINLNSITIPNSVTSIGGGAFAECTSLNSITIPNSVTSIGGAALQSCVSLNTLNCYVTRSIINASNALLDTASPFTIYARASDSTWTAGSDTIGGKTVTVVKNL